MPQVEKVNPYRDDSRTKDEQVRSMFDSIAPAYDFMNRAMTGGLDRLWLRRLVSEAVAASPGSIIDIATGTGDVAFALALALAIPAAYATAGEKKLETTTRIVDGLTYRNTVSVNNGSRVESNSFELSPYSVAKPILVQGDGTIYGAATINRANIFVRGITWQ